MGCLGRTSHRRCAGDALFNSPQHCIIVVGIGTHIGEGIVVPISGVPLARQRKVTICARVQETWD
mgnify:CR=1 FL=1